jgi:16S rRNA G966 N2-methylase RsmD
LFPYFGRKASTAKRYPSPRYPLVIEPFAGSLGYSCVWRPKAVLAIEADERVHALWHRLEALEGIPAQPEVGTKTDDLLVKLCSYSEHALTSGTMTVTSRMVRDWDFVHKRAIEAQAWVKAAVTYQLGSYIDAPDVEATWFIDPPYQRANRRGYRMGASGIDFEQLAEWVMRRRGQVIVCEQHGADWMPFKPLHNIASHRGSVSAEVAWMMDTR